jgi:hypothetical protein
MATKRLTQKFIESAKVKPGDSRTRYFDTRTVGFFLLVTDKGARSLNVYYRVPGVRSMRTMALKGLRLKEARDQAEKVLHAAKTGESLPAKRQRETAKQDGVDLNSLKHIVDEYFRLEGNRLRSAKDRRSALDRLVLPQWGKRRIYAITRSEIVALLDDVQKEQGPVMADRLLAYIRKIFNWYQIRNENFQSPIVRGMARTKPKQRRRKRVLEDIELRAVWKAAEELRLRDIPQKKTPIAVGVFSWMVMFLLLTAARRDDAAEAGWHEIASDRFTVPPDRFKTDQYLIIPLSAAAQDLLAKLPKISKRWVFSTNGKRPLSGFGKATAAFREKVLEILHKEDPNFRMKEDWTIHDLRRTARTLMPRAKVPYDIAERCIGHTRGEMDETYNMYAFLDERREAFEALAKLIMQIVNPAGKDEVDNRELKVA